MKKVLLIVGAIVLVLVASGVIAFLLTGGDRNMAQRFVADLVKNDIDSAYGQYSDELKRAQTKEALAAQVETLKLDDTCKLEVRSVSTSTSEGNTVTGAVKCSSKEYKAEFTYRSGALFGFRIQP